MRTSELSLIIARSFAGLFGIGRIPRFAAAISSAPALAAVLLPPFDRPAIILGLIIFLSIALLQALKHLEAKSESGYSDVAADKAIGMLIAICTPYIPFDIYWTFLAYILFLFLEKFPPFPIGRIREKQGLISVLADDVVLGIYSWIALHTIYAGYRVFGIILFFENI